MDVTLRDSRARRKAAQIESVQRQEGIYNEKQEAYKGDIIK